MGSGAARAQFETFVGDATRDLVRTAYLLTWDLAEAEDLVQETFVRVARRWDRVRAMDRPVAYARRVLVNLVLDGAPGRSRRRAELDAETDVGPDVPDLRSTGPFHRVDNAAEVRTVLAGLPRQQRAVLVLRYWSDLSEAETAEVLGCSVGTVKKAAWRALGRIRAAFPERAAATRRGGE
ncbi:hypothetical protein BJF78_14145 [Pseudonocardia sp. CNS-139]|nr:hypothetical protein BJF78_14145 [Pseudonocardia sp. CNS-139]